MMLTEAAGNAELVLWNGREIGHWLLKFITSACSDACRK
jgi:hypothetical protein